MIRSMRDGSRMRVNRCARKWRGFLLSLVLTVLGVGAMAPAAPAHGTGPPRPAPAPGHGSARSAAADEAGKASGGAGKASGGAGSPPVADPSVPAVATAWPVGGRPFVLRGWEPPATAYSRGHRGVDLAAAPGTPVLAVAPGRVSFAGRVGGRGVVSVELADTGTPPLRTTYGPVRASVHKGDEVAAGETVGTLEAGGAHCGPAACLHWGLLRGTVYLNPLSLLPAWLLNTGPSRLLPLTQGTRPGMRR